MEESAVAADVLLMIRTPLCELAEKYGTDKAGGGYTAFYHMLLGAHRERIRSVLELGIGTTGAMQHVPGYKPGASLRMWEEYFPNALIFGADIESGLMATREGRIITSLCDERQSGDLRRTIHLVEYVSGRRPDLIVDDALHTSDAQVFSANNLAHAVSPGGFYIIEDVASPHLVSSQLEFPHYAVMTRKGRGDQLIVIPR